MMTLSLMDPGGEDLDFFTAYAAVWCTLPNSLSLDELFPHKFVLRKGKISAKSKLRNAMIFFLAK